MIAVTMRDENGLHLRHRLEDRLDVRIDDRPGVDHCGFAEEVGARAVECEWARIGSGDAADVHGSTGRLLTTIGSTLLISAPRRDASNASTDVASAIAS